MLEFLTQSLAQSSLAERIGWMLVHSLWQFALVALVAVVLQWALQRRSATTRYWALLAAMFLMVAAPVATWFSPWSVDAPEVAARFGPADNPEEVALSQRDSPLQRGNDTVAMTALPAESPVELAAKPRPEPQRVQPAPIRLTSSWSLVKRHVQPWLPEIVLVWFAGVLVAAFRPLLSWYTVRRLRTVGASPVGDSVQKVLERTAKRLRFARAVDVLQSTLVKTPVVVGCFRPAVLLPLCVVTGLPESQLELILAHELAHIRRHDYLINLLQTLVDTLFFYHPAVWWLSRQIRNERENCCDDVAMATVGSRADYGRALLAIEELRAASTALSLAAHGGSLVARVRRIAGCEPTPRVVGGGSALCVILVSVAMYLAATADAAQPVEKPERTPVASTVPATAKVGGTIEPPSPDRPAPKGSWSLTLNDAIRYALNNSRVMRQMGAQVIGLPKSSTSNLGAAPSIDNPPEAIPGCNERVLIARLNTDIALTNFEAGVRNLVSDVEVAYWEVNFAYRNLDAVVTARDVALETWRKVHARQIEGAEGGAAADEAQAREQYFLFRSSVEKGLSSLYAAENKLRYIMGLAATDGRLIRPSEEPKTAKVTFDWREAHADALRRAVEIREQKGRIKQRELELTAAKDYVTSRGDTLKDVLANAERAKLPDSHIEIQAQIPPGFRKELSGVRNAQTGLARERARLQELELEVSHQVAYAIRDLEANLVLTQTNYNRRVAAQRQLDAVSAAYETGTITLDVLLQAQRTLAQAESDYHRSAVNYVKAISTVHFRKGSLLEYDGVYLAEDSKHKE